MKFDIDTISDRITEIDESIAKALSAVDDDDGASAVLQAVVQEFYDKSQKTVDHIESSAGEPFREYIVELEQAGDSAKVAAEADDGIKPGTRKAVLDAHDAICELKSQLAEDV